MNRGKAVSGRAIGSGIILSVLLAACASQVGPVRTAAVDQPHAIITASDFRLGSSVTGNYLAGRFAQKSRDYRTAAEYLSRALAADQENRGLLRRTFVVMVADGRMKEARAIARKIVEQDRGAPLANLALVNSEIKAGALDAAKTRLESITPRGLSTFMVPLVRGWVIAAQGDAEAAIEALEPISKISGFAVLYDLHAGLLNDLVDDTAQAEKHYLSAGKRSNRSTLRVVEALGSLYERTGRTDEARALYRKYMTENPDSLVLGPALDRITRAQVAIRGAAPKTAPNVVAGAAEAYFNMASTLTQENASEMALIYGRLALDLRPDFDIAKMLIGGILESLGRQPEAIEVYNGVTSGSALWWSARIRMATSMEAMGNVEEAIAQLRAMAGEKNARSDVLINLGDILRIKKRFAESVDAYDTAIKLIGNIGQRHWTLLYSRGIALERSKKWLRAEKDFIEALRLKPNQPYVLNYLGYSWVDQGINLVRARTMIERAVELRPNDGYIVDSLGWVLYRVGKFKPAVRQLERAVELRPQDPTINDHLGDAYWKVGRALEARFQWRRALSLDPEPDQGIAIRGKIRNGLDDTKTPDKKS